MTATYTPTRTGIGRTDRPSHTRAGAKDADSKAVASFALGLPGLLVANIFLGSTAIVLAVLALAQGTGRRKRAWFGLFLGVMDLVVLAVLITRDGTVSWGP